MVFNRLKTYQYNSVVVNIYTLLSYNATTRYLFLSYTEAHCSIQSTIL